MSFVLTSSLTRHAATVSIVSGGLELEQEACWVLEAESADEHEGSGIFGVSFVFSDDPPGIELRDVITCEY